MQSIDLHARISVVGRAAAMRNSMTHIEFSGLKLFHAYMYLRHR